MSSLDLAEIRAQLRATSEERRPPPRGPLRALKSLLAPPPRAPLLGPSAIPSRPSPAEPALVLDEPLSDEAIELDLRRSAFGQRPEAAASALAEPPPLLLTPIAVIDSADVGEALSRLRSTLGRRVEEPLEIPFLPEDLADDVEEDADRLYLGAGLPLGEPTAPPPAPAPTPGEALLMALEQRLVAEQMALISTLAGR